MWYLDTNDPLIRNNFGILWFIKRLRRIIKKFKWRSREGCTFPRAMAMAANPMSPPFLMLEFRLRAKSVPNTLISFWICTWLGMATHSRVNLKLKHKLKTIFASCSKVMLWAVQSMLRAYRVKMKKLESVIWVQIPITIFEKYLSQRKSIIVKHR